MYGCEKRNCQIAGGNIVLTVPRRNKSEAQHRKYCTASLIECVCVDVSRADGVEIPSAGVKQTLDGPYIEGPAKDSKNQNKQLENRKKLKEK
jgi:hypothetical protein